MKSLSVRPKKNEKVKWTSPIARITYNVLVHTVRVRSKTARIVQDFSSKHTMPFTYFWVDFNEIGY